MTAPHDASLFAKAEDIGLAEETRVEKAEA